MLDANLIQVLDADDETRHCLREGLAGNSTVGFTSEIIHYGTLQKSHDLHSGSSVPQRPSEQSAEREPIQDFITQTSTALDTLAKVCDHLLTHPEQFPGYLLLREPLPQQK